MTGPEAVPVRDAIAAFARIRAEGGHPDVDDEALAAFVDGGIEAVDPAARAQVLRAIGQSPVLAALVAELASTRPDAARGTDRSALGIGRGAWRLAWAACALLAVSFTAWMVVGAPEPRQGDAIVLLESAPHPAADHPGRLSEWFAGTPVRVLVAALWVAFCILAVPAFRPVREPEGRGTGSKG